MSPKVSDEHKEQRRQQILEAAARVFIRKGYEPTTLKDIVEEADMSRGWIYLYFQTKEQIFEALMQKLDDEGIEETEQLIRQSRSLWEAIETSLTLHIKQISEIDKGLAPTIYEYFMTGWRDESRRALFTKRYDKAIAQGIRLIERGVERGEFAPSQPAELIAQVMSSHLDGILMHALAVGPDKVNASQQIRLLVGYLKQLLRVKE
jgi:AcrR family transcriptional regulator